MKNNLFFGWNNIKWFMTQIANMYSAKPSYFSKKRVESGIAFFTAQWGMIYFLLEKHTSLGMSDFALWAGIEFAISGYIIHQIQNEKSRREKSKEVEQTEQNIE